MQSAGDPADLAARIKHIARDFGFQAAAITDTRLDTEAPRYHAWIERHYHGEMSFLERNIDKRLQPENLVPGTLSVICLRMDYHPSSDDDLTILLDHPEKAYVSRYALGRDYHKLIRRRLAKLARAIEQLIGPFGHRVFTDSAPVLEKALAARAGLGWVGKHSNLIDRDHGSWFFLGEIYTDLELPADQPVSGHCGDCHACIDCCPTDAIVSPYVVDARRCISYLTIEHPGVIPLEFRKAIGNRIYGCDDCQIFCPWTRFTPTTRESDFAPRNGLDSAGLLELFDWTEEEFLQRLEGSAIRRIGYDRWRRNLAVALGNAAGSPHIVDRLQRALPEAPDMVAGHVQWAIDQQMNK
jgi:epoxyqueuosine reductase